MNFIRNAPKIRITFFTNAETIEFLVHDRYQNFIVPEHDTPIERENTLDFIQLRTSLFNAQRTGGDDCKRETKRARSLACAHEQAPTAVQLQLCVQAGNAGGGMEAAWWAHSVSSPLPPFSLSHHDYGSYTPLPLFSSSRTLSFTRSCIAVYASRSRSFH